MLRDIPKVYAMLLFFGLAISLLVMWYVLHYKTDSDTLQLNDIILTSALSEVDHVSRVHMGAFLLADTFEVDAWERIDGAYNNGDRVQFDYLFDQSDSRFGTVAHSTHSSPTYIVGGQDAEIPVPSNMDYVTMRPLKEIRVKVQKKGDKIGDWTYIATVTVDAVSKANQSPPP